MKSKWKTIRLGMMLFALPMVATAAASAHSWVVDSNPISIELNTEVAEESAIGLARVHTVALNRNGAVEGRIASMDVSKTTGISSLKVFFVQDGEVVSESRTAADGTFVAHNLPEGVYSFVATGKSGFAAYGVRVVSDADGMYDNVMEAAAVSPNFAAVKNILNERLPAAVAEQVLASSDIESEQAVIGANRVQLKSGALSGQVVALLGGKDAVNGTYVHIIKDDQQVAEVQADESGSFMVSDLEPGVYDFVAAGPSGFAAVSFEAVQDEEVGAVIDGVDSEEIPVAIAYQALPADIPLGGGFGDSLDVCLTCQGDSGFVSDQISYVDSSEVFFDDAPIEYAGESIGCGCASGGCCGAASSFGGFSSCNSCGGGGGFGGGAGGVFRGGGGLGRLLALGGLAVGIVAIADDDDDDDPDDASPESL